MTTRRSCAGGASAIIVAAVAVTRWPVRPIDQQRGINAGYVFAAPPPVTSRPLTPDLIIKSSSTASRRIRNVYLNI